MGYLATDHTFIISAASLYRDWGQKFYFSKTVGQPPPVLPLPKNSNPPPVAISPLSYTIFSLTKQYWDKIPVIIHAVDALVLKITQQDL